MTTVTGLGTIERLLLDELYDPTTTTDRTRFRRTDEMLAAVSASHGIHPRDGYNVALDLCRPWVAHLRLLEMKGNIGTVGFGAAEARYTGVRLSQLGALIADAERRNVQLPVGLINGDHHAGGVRPPFDPGRVIEAVRAAWNGASDGEIVAAVGLPEWPTRCEVSGDSEAVASGASTTLDLRVRVELRPPDLLMVTCPTPERPGDLRGSVEQFAGYLRHHDRAPTTTPRPSFSVDDYSGTEMLVVAQTEPGADPTDVRQQLLKWWPLAIRVEVSLGKPLVNTVRAIVEGGDRAAFENFANLAEEQLNEPPGPYPAHRWDDEAEARHRERHNGVTGGPGVGARGPRVTGQRFGAVED